MRSRTLNRLRPLVSAAATFAAAAVAFACSSSSSGSPGTSGDASTDTGQDLAGDAGSDAPEDAIMSTEPCDASVVLPTDGATGSACGKCLEMNCSAALAMCKNDCLCVAPVECLATNKNDYVVCMDALSAISAGNPGLTAIAACIANKCLSTCNPTD